MAKITFVFLESMRTSQFFRDFLTFSPIKNFFKVFIQIQIVKVISINTVQVFFKTLDTIWRFGVTSAKSIGHYLSIKFNSVLQDLKKSFQPTFVKTSHAIEFENGS